VGFALLIFTPSALCLASAALLTALTRGALGAGALATGGFFGVAHHGATAGHPGLRWLAFPLVVAAYRLWTRKASACDLAFVLMLAGVAILSVVPNMPAPLHHMEIVYLAMGGATALLGQSPPKGMAGGMLVSVSLLGAWVV